MKQGRWFRYHVENFMTNKTIALIFARGGSKGVFQKNLREVAGVPLIGRAVQTGLACQSVDSIMVSTDCHQIAAIARKYGAMIPFMRPEHLSTDTCSELLAWQHALQHLIEANKVNENDFFVSLPTTSPLRSAEDVESAIQTYTQNPELDMVMGISESHRNPYLNMVTINPDNTVDVVNQHSAVRRQDVPSTYDLTTVVYVASVGYILRCSRIIEGNIGYVKIPVSRAIDIDTEYDLHVANLLAQYPYQGGKL